MAKGIDVAITRNAGGGTPATYSLERQIAGGGYSVIDGSIAFTASPQTYSDTNGGSGFTDGAVVDYRATATNTDGTSSPSTVEQITISGGGGSVDADYQAILDYATGQTVTLPDAAQQTAQNQLVVDLKAAGVWNKLDILYIIANNGSEDFGLLNWKAPALFELVPTGGNITWTPDIGFGCGATSYVYTGWNPSNDGVNYVQDSAHIMLQYSSLASGIDSPILSNSSAPLDIDIAGGDKGTTANIHLNASGNTANIMYMSNGINIYDRQDATNLNMLNDYETDRTTTAASTGVGSSTATVGDIRFMKNNIADTKVGAMGMGASTYAERVAYKTAMDTYFTNI